IINSLFGINIQIPGLDFLLYRGLLQPTTTGLTVAIKGNPGTGKTMLSLQLAASVAAEGHLAVYLSAEEDLNLLTGRLSYAGYKQIPRLEKPYLRTATRGSQEFSLLTYNELSENGDISELFQDNASGVL